MGEAPPSPAQVAQVIRTLYSVGNPGAQKEANTWLTSYATTQAAWEASIALLDAEETEVKYFSANVLLNKVRDGWLLLPAEAQGQLTGAIFGKLQVLATQPQSLAVTRRLCLVLAAGSAKSGPEAAAQFCQNALGLASSAPVIAVTLLGALAEETPSIPGHAQQALMGALSSQMTNTLALVEAAAGTGGAAEVEAMQCLMHWMNLDPTNCNCSLMSAGQLYATSQGCFQALLKALSCDNEAAFNPAVDCLEKLLVAGPPGNNPAAEEAAINMAIHAILANQMKALEEGSYEHARGLARIAVACCERDPERIAAGAGDSCQLTEFMLRCTQHEERAVVESSMEYFLGINTVAMASRHPSHQAVLFQRLLEYTLKQAAYDADFTSWEDQAGCDDPDSFKRFREQILADICGVIYDQIRVQYLRCMGQALQSATTWQAAEAPLFAIRAVSINLKQHLYTKRASDLQDEVLNADRAESNSFLEALFRQICDETGAAPLLSSHPMIMDSNAQLIGSYAQWFGQHPAAPVQSALSLLLKSLQIPEVWAQGANSFRNVCNRCTTQLHDPTVILPLIDAVERYLPPTTQLDAPSAGLEERSAIVQGLGRVVSTLNSTDAGNAGLRLIGPMIARAQQLLPTLPTNPPAVVPGPHSEALSIELTLIASALRFMDGFPVRNDVKHPAMAMLEATWPLLDALAKHQQWCSDLKVVESLCEIYSKAVSSIKLPCASLVPGIVQAVMTIFSVHPHPPCLGVIKVITEVFGSQEGVRDEGVSAALRQALESACQRSLECLQPNMLHQLPELIGELFEMVHTFVMFSPNLLLSSPIIASLFSTATLCVRQRERDPVRASSNFLATLLNPGEKAVQTPIWQASWPTVTKCVEQHGEELVASVLYAVADTCPTHLMKPLGSVLYSMLAAYPGPTQQLIVKVIGRPDYPVGGEGAQVLTEADRQVVCMVATRNPALPKQNFECFIQDIGKVCRRDATGDTLLAYQI